MRRSLEIIELFKPALWLIENPQTGYLKTRPVIQGIPWRDVTYCKYGFPYKKRTRLWGWFPFELRPVCKKGDYCPYVVDDKHCVRLQDFCSLRDRYRVPPQLCDEIALLADVWLSQMDPFLVAVAILLIIVMNRRPIRLSLNQ